MPENVGHADISVECQAAETAWPASLAVLGRTCGHHCDVMMGESWLDRCYREQRWKCKPIKAMMDNIWYVGDRNFQLRHRPPQEVCM